MTIYDQVVAGGTMMGPACLRVNGASFAMQRSRTGELIVKLDGERIEELVEAGIGSRFVPSGRAFREWMSVGGAHLDTWNTLVDEARRFVGG